MVFYILKGHEPHVGSLMYQVLNVSTVHPQARQEIQLLKVTTNRLCRSDQLTGRILLDHQSRLRKNYVKIGIFYCPSNSIHWFFRMIGLVAVPL